MTLSEEDSEIDAQHEAAESNKTKRKSLLREAMRDVLFSLFLLALTTLVTHGDFQKSPTSSLLASGKIQCCLKIGLFLNVCECF